MLCLLTETKTETSWEQTRAKHQKAQLQLTLKELQHEENLLSVNQRKFCLKIHHQIDLAWRISPAERLGTSVKQWQQQKIGEAFALPGKGISALGTLWAHRRLIPSWTPKITSVGWGVLSFPVLQTHLALQHLRPFKWEVLLYHTP